MYTLDLKIMSTGDMSNMWCMVYLQTMSKRCGCIKHRDFQEAHLDVRIHMYKLSSRKVPKNIITKMVAKGFISPRSTYLCSLCPTLFEEVTMSSSPKKKKSKTTIDVSRVVTAIQNDELTINDQMRIEQALGTAFSKAWFEDTKQFGQRYKDILTEGNKSAITSDCHNVVKTFVQALCTARDKATKNPKIDLALEELYHVYCARNEKFVGPVSFAQGVLVYFCTRSKTACNILANISPSGSYHTIVNWINEKSNHSLAPPTVDHITFFDNNWQNTPHPDKSKSSQLRHHIHDPYQPQRHTTPAAESTALTVHLAPEFWSDNCGSGQAEQPLWGVGKPALVCLQRWLW